MALCDLALYPAPVLRKECKVVQNVNQAAHKLIADLKDTLSYQDGVGLAAPQIKAPLRVAVIDLAKMDHERDDVLVMVNPEILETEGEDVFEEGCLSIPGAYAKIKRPVYTKISALDENGDSYEFEASGFLSAAINHEIDHLDGVLIQDYLGPVKKKLFLKKARKAR